MRSTIHRCVNELDCQLILHPTSLPTPLSLLSPMSSPNSLDSTVVLGLDDEAASDDVSLRKNMHIRFEPAAVTDYTLCYQGVFFHVHRARLMEQSAYFREALRDLSNEPLVLPDLRYETIVDVDTIEVSVMTATADDFLVILAMLYWPERFADIFTSVVDLNVRLRRPVDEGRGVPFDEGVVDYSSVVVVQSSMSAPVFVPALAWLLQWDCERISSLCASSLKRAITAHGRLDEGHDFAFSVCRSLWLCETYKVVNDAELRAMQESVWLMEPWSLLSKAPCYHLLSTKTVRAHLVFVQDRHDAMQRAAEGTINDLRATLFCVRRELKDTKLELAMVRSAESGKRKRRGSMNLV